MRPNNKYTIWDSAPNLGPRINPERTTKTLWNVIGTSPIFKPNIPLIDIKATNIPTFTKSLVSILTPIFHCHFLYSH